MLCFRSNCPYVNTFPLAFHTVPTVLVNASLHSLENKGESIYAFGGGIFASNVTITSFRADVQLSIDSKSTQLGVASYIAIGFWK